MPLAILLRNQSLLHFSWDLSMNHHSDLKASLEVKLQSLLERATEIENTLSAPGNSDWEDKAIETENNDSLMVISTVTNLEIREIKLALSRIESGHYGVCCDCGATISKERLAVIPYATTCIGCA